MSKNGFSNIRNILLVGRDYDAFDQLIQVAEEKNLNITLATSKDLIKKSLNTDVQHLIIFDALLGYDLISDILKDIHYMEMTNLPKVLMTHSESLDERYDYFNLGITNFFDNHDMHYFMDLLNRMDKEETYKRSFKELSIAILDDDRLHLKILKDILDRNGVYNVDTFSHPKDLLDSSVIYDIYLIDLILPDIDGEIVMYEIRKRHEHAVIVGISSIEKHTTIAKVLAIGANDYLTKPVIAPVFMAKLYNFGKNLILKRENVMKTKILQELASKDGLTGLYNHRHIQELLGKMVMQAKRHSRPISVIMLDIDDFKLINDKYGHQFGDEVLRRVSGVLLDSVREHDLVGRYGGEEFLIILPDTTQEEGVKIAERIQENVMELIFDDHVKTSLSGGVASLKDNAKQMIYDADCLLYKAKYSGKRKIEYSLESLNTYETC
ncbi:diguanylate cyclase [Acidaminobacter sp. JC074]|uniref:GGDEF domain-containing response regulator n=1 Tax=Acidaminobacter sp. JC074 TaxID=2530199 RepID=UPI001F0E7A83|nr:diguanylate cyclase [Acidaminobacter sp. JC074]MCH4890363.1 diguanylate cyclase [Acidaminobacter sp. JC074]